MSIEDHSESIIPNEESEQNLISQVSLLPPTPTVASSSGNSVVNGVPGAFNIYNALVHNNSNQYAFYVNPIFQVDPVGVANRWQQNFQYALGPTNSAFIDATLSYQDIAWGYRLEYNPNGVLWRVSATGIPNPDDYNNFLEQNRVIESTNNRTMKEFGAFFKTTQESNGTESETPAVVQGASKTADKNLTQDTKSGSDPLEFKLEGIQPDGTPLFYATKDAVAQETSKVDYSMLYRANGLSPEAGGYTNLTYIVNTVSLVSRPYYEGAIIHTQDGFFKVINGVDTYIDPPPKETLYWDQNNNNSGLGFYKVTGYENPQFWGLLGGTSIALMAGKAATEVAALAQETSVSEKILGIFGPLNKGPLPEGVANSFRSATYSQKILEDDIILYRVYGGKANELGSFWTRTKPEGPLQSIIDSALDQNWGNTATEVAQIRVPQGTTIFEGFAAPQGGLVGGGNQIFIYLERVDPSWLIR